MKTLGYTMEKYLSLLIFKIGLDLFIIFTALQLLVGMLVGNISGHSAHQRANLEKLNQSLIGSNTTDLVQTEFAIPVQ